MVGTLGKNKGTVLLRQHGVGRGLVGVMESRVFCMDFSVNLGTREIILSKGKEPKLGGSSLW